MQDWNTADMVFDEPALIEFLSGSKTLLPGTVILTGTPHGVGFVAPGDRVVTEIEGVGRLENTVLDDAAFYGAAA
jgi:2-keto-4-pentenoate hydratase/2-oxohepta-3-ene-1,7-dioic acid hydratase in catechol pathway